MQKSFIKIALTVTLIFSINTTKSFGQNNTLQKHEIKQLTTADSALLKKYFENIDASSVFSHKRQLYLDSALAICPWRASWWQQKAMPLFKLRKCEAGMPYLDSAVKYDTQKYLDYRAFMKCIFQRSYKESIKDFEIAKIVNGQSSIMDHTYDFYIGLCYLQLNKLDSAKYYITKSIDHQKKTLSDGSAHFLDWFYLGVVLYELEDYKHAIETFDNSLKIYKQFSDVKYYKAICLKKTNQDQQALSLMKEAALDFKQGYTINEDNAVYETYPYQVYKESYYTSGIKALEKNQK